jgi:hypothetical protein
MTASSARKLALIVLGFAIAACEALEPAERATIDAWLGCTECNEHELDSVLALAVRKHEPTVTALRDGLLEGPTSVQRQNASRQLDTLYDRVVVVGGPMLPMNPRTEFVRHYLDNIVATYRVRSAVALAHIGGADVKPALDSAAANQLRIPSDTLRPADLDAVAFARDSIWQP